MFLELDYYYTATKTQLSSLNSGFAPKWAMFVKKSQQDSRLTTDLLKGNLKISLVLSVNMTHLTVSR